MKKTNRQKEIFRKIAAERARQEEKHGENSLIKHDSLGFINYAILGEEVGEVGRALLDCHLERKFPAQRKFPETAKDHLEEEIVQVAAVCVAWLEALEGDEK